MDTKASVYFDLVITLFQWGHNLSVMDTPNNSPCSHPGNGQFQWGHNLSVMDTIWQNHLLLGGRHGVSMGPQPVGHGYRTTGRRTTRDRSRFNGATTCRSWIPSSTDDNGIELTKFQWGHNLSVMDTGKEINVVIGHNRYCFNGATTCRSWIRAPRESCGRRFSRCFNGATTCRSWIPREGREARATLV